MVARPLPDFPWDRLAPAKARASTHPDGLVDLSIGAPVDPVPAPVQAALAGAADAPGYPLTAGTPALREAIASWVARSCGVQGGPRERTGAAPSGLRSAATREDGATERRGAARAERAPVLRSERQQLSFGVLPTIGSKELVGSLPTLLGLGPGDTVVIPSVCYPTYEVGARLAGASLVRSDSLLALGPSPRVRLVWVNSPANPTGRVLPPAHLRKMVDWARERGAVLASDECYLPLGWETEPVSIMSVCDGDFTGVLAVHSLSKRSNLAGYRAGFVAGDPALLAALLEIRKHAGLIVPAPVQAAMVAALSDESHVRDQRARYGARRSLLARAFTGAGFTVEHSEAGLYLWATRGGESGWSTVADLAGLGILVAPGEFYGPAGVSHVRIALTASDERCAAAAARLAAAAAG